jgi:1-phosphatidylinositol-3-phosphate 5-kinase
MATRPTLPASSKSYRRAPGTGNKVSSIAKHFERINKENERANRRYSVIRGRRARPVATARAKVEVLHSLKDVIKDDESESADSSSEADDEGDGDDEGHKTMAEPVPESSPPSTVAVDPAPGTEAPLASVEDATTEIAVVPEPPPPESSLPKNEVPASIPPSPLLDSVQSPSLTPPHDIDIIGTQSHSLLKTLGLWLHQPPPRYHRSEAEIDDPMVDPEHIFRDSSMVVRTDEPTSIIALALK